MNTILLGIFLSITGGCSPLQTDTCVHYPTFIEMVQLEPKVEPIITTEERCF